jgi:hypothetical protein
MHPPKRAAKTTIGDRLRWPTAVAVGLVLGSSMILGGQTPPPAQGAMALEGSMKQFYRAANVVVVTTIDGVEHMYHFAKNMVVHGGKEPGVDALEGLRGGSTVVVHYTIRGEEASVQEIDLFGDEGLKITEGVISHVDRRRKEITIKYANGKTETLRMTDRAAAESEKVLEGTAADVTKIVVYYSDDAGRKVAHYFKKTS